MDREKCMFKCVTSDCRSFQRSHIYMTALLSLYFPFFPFIVLCTSLFIITKDKKKNRNKEKERKTMKIIIIKTRERESRDHSYMDFSFYINY